MCGIAGIVFPGRLATSLTASVERMCAALHHRGPDGIGTYVAGGIALGHARLAIARLRSLVDIHAMLGQLRGPLGEVPRQDLYALLVLELWLRRLQDAVGGSR